jgi:YegS/Rv2252/BmrU family lipid kinase
LHLKLIVNPAASGTNIKKLIPEITDFFKKNGASISLEYTAKPHEASNLAKIAAQENFNAIVAVGGDGTVNEVVNGIINSKVALGVIPAGSANDFAKGLQIPQKINEACRCVLAGNTRKIDIGKVNDRYFINIAGVGLDAQVSEAVSKSPLRAKGLLQYTVALAKVLINSHPKEFNLSLDGKTRRVKAWLISVGNGKQFGGGMKIIPTADISDGLFDICVIKDVKKWRVICYLPLVIQGKHLTLSKVAIYRAKEVEVKALGCLGHADGEIMKGDIFKFELIPEALQVIVP